MGRLEPETRKSLLDRFLRDCEIAESVAKPSGTRGNRKLQQILRLLQEQGNRAKIAVSSRKPDNPLSQIPPNSKDKVRAEGQDPKASSPEAEATPMQGSSSNIDKVHTANTNQPVKENIPTRDTIEEINHETEEQSLSRADSPLTSQSETQSPRTTRAHKVSEVTRTEKIKELSRSTRKSERVTSQTHDQVST
ncbi:uncharacterized protein MELLADRAFT_84127 [Melampsora larici-populina 98AG31]|uniref:Uncharacterized protein n=1 Tax=Melampsora larici-populina (strain 98AG31 / pathotype 3-4-7) TaxID=747676 RepID=F4SBK7_MELLP|nr:uncharacterized protein MELLADRAFT_84127 [Melampsora larici-populina 98AG31]EGF97976.1 hypothetical protein MELLADRAFT_84127 [Melampsora larici-populina 98AG31]